MISIPFIPLQKMAAEETSPSANNILQNTVSPTSEEPIGFTETITLSEEPPNGKRTLPWMAIFPSSALPKSI